MAWLELLLSPLLTALELLELFVLSELLDVPALLDVVSLVAAELVEAVLDGVAVASSELVLEVVVLSWDVAALVSPEANATPVRAATPSDPVRAPATMPARSRRVRRRAASRAPGVEDDGERHGKLVSDGQIVSDTHDRHGQ